MILLSIAVWLRTKRYTLEAVPLLRILSVDINEWRSNNSNEHFLPISSFHIVLSFVRKLKVRIQEFTETFKEYCGGMHLCSIHRNANRDCRWFYKSVSRYEIFPTVCAQMAQLPHLTVAHDRGVNRGYCWSSLSERLLDFDMHRWRH